MIWQLNSISTTSRLLPTINHTAVELSRQVLKLKIYNMISEGGGLTTYQLLSSKTEVKLLLLQKAVKNLPGVDSNRTTESGRRSWPVALVGEACVSSVCQVCVNISRHRYQIALPLSSSALVGEACVSLALAHHHIITITIIITIITIINWPFALIGESCVPSEPSMCPNISRHRYHIPSPLSLSSFVIVIFTSLEKPSFSVLQSCDNGCYSF